MKDLKFNNDFEGVKQIVSSLSKDDLRRILKSSLDKELTIYLKMI